MPFDGIGVSQVASDLIKARQLIVDRGWQPYRGDYGGSHCPVTALMEAQDHTHLGLFGMGAIALTPRFRRAYRALRTALPKSERDGFMAVPAWNVAQCSREPALKLFDRAIGDELMHVRS